MTQVSPVDAIIEQQHSRHLEQLCQWLRIPSISAQPAHHPDAEQAAAWLAERLHAAGATQVAIHPTPGLPIVLANTPHDPQKPTVLVYGHYDVQPPEPLELWHSPPFEPEVREGAIYARGACDDKGQLYMHVAALDAMQQSGPLPCNIKFIVEGEEEIGSPSLEAFVAAHREALHADVLLISDTDMLSTTQPSITTGLRGLAYMEVCVRGPNRDLHSGLYGGAVVNPLNALCAMIAQLHDTDGRVTVPGFYTGIDAPDDALRAALAKVPFDETAWCSAIGVERSGGEGAYSVLERVGMRPTLDVNGIWGGYTGEGAKTVIASEARAKISMRLVPGQDHNAVAQQFADYFPRLAPAGVQVEVQALHGGNPAVTPIDSTAYRAASAAYAETFGIEPLPLRSGGSIPVVELFQRLLGTPAVLMGFGLSSDAIHSPNEHFGLFNFRRGIETIPRFYQHFAALQR